MVSKIQERVLGPGLVGQVSDNQGAAWVPEAGFRHLGAEAGEIADTQDSTSCRGFEVSREE